MPSKPKVYRSFSEDSRGRWYFNVAVQVPEKPSAGTAAVGIDLGTTHSLAAVWREGGSVLIPNPLGQVLTPSCISIDDDGDFQITVRVDDERTQLVWVRSAVESTDHHKVREIWSPGYRTPTGDFTPAIANDLLERSNNLKLGAWVKQDDVAMLVIKIPADASADALDEAIDLAAASADAVERELLGSDEL